MFNIDPRTFGANPYVSSPSGSFPKAINLLPSSGGGAESVLRTMFDVPSSVYTTIESGFAQATATQSNSGGGASVDPLGGGLVV
jgi:hypothetical protein